MWPALEARGAPSHPRRQLTAVGGGDEVYEKFLAWPKFRNFKDMQPEGFTVPDRAAFLNTRCGCLGSGLIGIGTLYFEESYSRCNTQHPVWVYVVDHGGCNPIPPVRYTNIYIYEVLYIDYI